MIETRKLKLERKNKTENSFEKLAETLNWKVSKRGWPDFICIKPDGTVCVTEIKPKRKRFNKDTPLVYLKKAQVLVMRFLQSLGVECNISDGKTIYPFDSSIYDEQGKRKRKPRITRKMLEKQTIYEPLSPVQF